MESIIGSTQSRFNSLQSQKEHLSFTSGEKLTDTMSVEQSGVEADDTEIH